MLLCLGSFLVLLIVFCITLRLLVSSVIHCNSFTTDYYIKMGISVTVEWARISAHFIPTLICERAGIDDAPPSCCLHSNATASLGNCAAIGRKQLRCDVTFSELCTRLNETIDVSTSKRQLWSGSNMTKHSVELKGKGGKLYGYFERNVYNFSQEQQGPKRLSCVNTGDIYSRTTYCRSLELTYNIEWRVVLHMA
jgi:hypothetical protein